ncbi:uncharacterized protein MYCFIDRAFT_55271 [Pseudocercospora fijiensis CIRAD86]|uniref:Nuclear pore complex protein n=1 Tax=Pseudocercospora fijiensis (strain CIRAD86) TaxID=383855 RepID=N1Q6V1_PSEFD|nr:uncharacterized protein MYCFIDRAFT_55271 [Pseudocercospora fijiensis CIRAD86]EME88274.1 hypothetical protein MYCFIDRAFT_55271 [Pseudocercospora fijiensis CIRAD86]
MVPREEPDDHDANIEGDIDADTDAGSHEAPRASRIFGGANGNLDDAVQPLREMADRVGSEVEAFAERLDMFIESLCTGTSQTYDLVVELVGQFKEIAREAALKLESDYRRERAQQLRKEWNEQNPDVSYSRSQNDALATSTSLKLGGSMSEAKREQVAIQRQWQQEADIWDLFHIILDVHHNPQRSSQFRQQNPSTSDAVHRYTTEKQLWDRFLLTDDLAHERSLVKTWLEQSAEHQASDLNGIVEELEAKAGRGKGLWHHGWMHTREHIKHEKRMRAWPAPDADPLPQLRSTDKAELLVTSLDPDAATRQDRVLEKPDAHFEQAMWIACWEMLRRGKSWEEVSQWCEERHESWRAIALGKGFDQSQLRSSATFRKIAYAASKSKVSNSYEAAVYGLLGGNIHATQKVCRSMDDHLHAHYSAALVRQFDKFLAVNHPNRGRNDPLPDGTLEDQDLAIYDLLARLRSEASTKDESVQPMKIIESYVIANDVGSMIHTLGFALSLTDQQSGRREKMIAHLEPFWENASQNEPEEAIGLNPHTLRIAAHMGILLDILAPQDLQGDEAIAKMNVIVAYIQTLRAAGKRDLIPVYASRLSMGAYVMVMSHVLEDITTPREQDETLKLLRQYNLDVVFILNEQLGYVLDKLLTKNLKAEKPVNMLKPSDDAKHPGQHISEEFLADEHPEEDSKVIASLKWFDIVEGLWERTFYSLSLALRKALISGRIALAIKIINTYPYEDIAVRKSYQEIGKSYNPMDDEQAPSAEAASHHIRMRKESRCYYELSLLVQAIKALGSWRTQEAEYIEKHPRLTGASPDLKAAKEAVTEAMDPVLNGLLLLGDSFADADEKADEKADCAQIRQWYVPELVIAYNTVLHSAGYLISRDNLIDSMDLSVTVADEKNLLSEVCVQAGRMRELVASFASTSKAMLVLKAEGKKWTSRKMKGREGKDLGIWEIGSQVAVRPSRTLSLS